MAGQTRSNPALASVREHLRSQGANWSIPGDVVNARNACEQGQDERRKLREEDLHMDDVGLKLIEQPSQTAVGGGIRDL
jgi:hypothetical protein